MIAVVALNPALDVTHHVDGVDWASVNRPAAVQAMPGGKGLNVARTLRALGADVLLLGLAGGSTGAAVRAGLRAAGVPAIFTEIAAETRRTFVVVDTSRGEVASFYEPGAEVTALEYARFLAGYADVLPRCTAVVLSGSLPPGLPASTYAELTQAAATAGVPVVLDTSGEPLLHGASAGPAIIKPNLAELAAAAGRDLRWSDQQDQAAVLSAAAQLRQLGARAVVVSLGAHGLLAVTHEGAWHAMPEPVPGNPTGAGDAAVAGLAHGLAQGSSWPDRLRHAAALGSATAAAPIAGEFAAHHYRLALEKLEVREMGQDSMADVPIQEILAPARATGRAAPAFNVIGIEHAEAIVAGAEAAGQPVILQLSQNCVDYHGRLEPVGRAMLAIAAAAAVPVAVHLDHATSEQLVHEAVGLGFGSAMYDASTLPYADNVRATAAVTAWCHARGVWVEAELGEIGGKDGVHAPGARTRPGEAAAYVAGTGVDGLAVAVGSSHAMLTRDAVLDLELIRALRAAVPVPLVLHGSSGVPDQTLTAAVRAGLTKINIATQLNKVFTAAVRGCLADDPLLADPRRYLRAGRAAIAAEVQRLMGVLAGTALQEDGPR